MRRGCQGDGRGGIRARGRAAGIAALAAALLLASASPGFAAYDEYRPDRAGHPLRILAYALHPAGVILDRLVFHPAWWIAQFEPIATLVGRKRLPEERVRVED